MDLNPYVQGFMTAVVYLTSVHFLPKRIRGNKRYAVAIPVAVVVSLLVQLLIDCVAKGI